MINSIRNVGDDMLNVAKAAAAGQAPARITRAQAQNMFGQFYKISKKRFKKRLKILIWQLRHGLIELDKARSVVDSLAGWMRHANTHHLRHRLGIDILRRYIMRGMPKNLNTKTDYLYLKDNYNRAYWEQSFQNLLDTRYDWFMIDKEDYKEDENHKIVHDDQEDTDTYFEYRENENAPIYQLGFTVKKVQDILAG